jgi:hypothetical protein
MRITIDQLANSPIRQLNNRQRKVKDARYKVQVN